MRLCPIFKWSIQCPSHPAAFIGNTTISYKELNHLVESECNFIESLHLPTQSRLPFIAANTLETASFFFAAWRMKMVACPLSFRLPKAGIEKALLRLNASLITPQSIPAKDQKHTELDETLLATLLFTSGTTGEPKIACHRLFQHLKSAEVAIPHLQLGQQSRYLSNLPFSHVGGIALLLRTFLAGSALVISSHFKDATHISCVPTQLYRRMQEKTIVPDQSILLGGAPISLNLYNQAIEQKLNLYTTYGMTETSSMMTLKKPENNSFSLGSPLEHSELRIETDGEILVRGKTLFDGYLNLDGSISLPLKDGWFATKDRGYLKEGCLHFLGRKDRLFISGGENIQPEEIEEAILALFNLSHAVVLPFEDEEFGMRPAVYLDDPTLTLEVMQRNLRKVLPGYKIPQKLFPLSPTFTLKIDAGSDSETLQH